VPGQLVIGAAPANATSFQIVAQTAGTFLITDRLFSPGGEVLLSNDRAQDHRKTTAVGGDFWVNALPYPAGPQDSAIEDGTYTQVLVAIDDPFSNANPSTTTGALVAKNDPDLNEGRLRVNLFYAGSLAQSAAIRNTIQNAVETWRQIYSGARISLNIREFDVAAANGTIPDPFFGSEYYAANGSPDAVQQYAVNLYVAEHIADAGGFIAGISPSIPGPALKDTTKSAVAISISVIAGPDGVFNVEETNFLGETMAHEAAHYLGLFHPVEYDGTTADAFSGDDSLTDTPTCTSIQACQGNGLVANLMFPIPVNGVRQVNITAEQKFVMNLQAIVD